METISYGHRVGGFIAPVAFAGLRTLLCSVLVVPLAAVRAAPNDDCKNAVFIIEGVPAVEGNNASADPVDESEASCTQSDYDVWYAYTATCTGSAMIDTFGSLQDDTALSVYDTCGGVEIACNDDSNDTLSALLMPVLSGTTYWIRLASVDSPGDFDLNITCNAVPANDTCAAAQQVFDGTAAAQGDNSGADSLDDDEASCRDSDYDVWFTFEAACTGAVRIDTIGSEQADTVLTVYDFCGGNEIACVDDGGGTQAGILLDVLEGESYWVRLASVGKPGEYVLNLGCEPVPLNQNCLDAIIVTDATPAAQGDNSGAVAPDDGEASCRESDRDVWFAYTATCTGAAVVDTFGSGQTDTVLSAFDGCGGEEIACGDDIDGTLSRILFPVIQNEEYVIRLATVGDPGDYDLNISCEEVLVNDICAGALPIVEGVPAMTGTNVAAFNDGDSASCREASHDVWFEYVPSCSGSAVIDTFGSGADDTVLSVYDACGGNEIACDDDTDGTHAEVFFQVDGGTSYWIRLATVGMPGDYVLNITVPRSFAPTSDDASDVLDTVVLCSDDDQCLNESVCIDGRCYVPKHRYLSLKASPSNIAFETARRVRIEVADDVYQTVGFVGPPMMIAAGGAGDAARLTAELQSEPYYTSWNFLEDDTVEVTGCAIAPGNRYAVESINCGAPIDVEAGYSEPLVLPTVAVFGDCCGGEAINTPPDGVANFVDVQSGVACFTTDGTQLPRTWCDLDPTSGPANQLIVNFGDVLILVNGLQQQPYPQDPLDCGE